MGAEHSPLGDKHFRLPGLGSYLKTVADAGDDGALMLGLATLIVIIVLLDQFVWRPLVAWSEKFRFEQTESGEAATSAVLVAFRRSRLVEWFSENAMPRIGDAIEALAGGIARLSVPPLRSGERRVGEEGRSR